MEYKLELIKDDSSGYSYRFGQFFDGQLNGIGKYVVTKNEESSIYFEHYEVGEFKNGKLNGIAKLIENNKVVHIGLFENGEPLNTLDYIKNISSEDVNEFEYQNIKYVGKRYFQNKEEGYQIVICHKKIVHFISGPTIQKSDQTYYHFAYLSNGKEEGLSIDFLLDEKGNISEERFFINFKNENYCDSEMITKIINSNIWNFRGLIYDKEIRINEGQERVTGEIYNGEYGCTIYIPSSITYLGPKIVKGKGNNFVQVYYDGTKEEWEKIEKGKVEWEEVSGATWYYYGHDAMPERIIKDWVSDVWKVFVHCKDGLLIEEERE